MDLDDRRTAPTGPSPRPGPIGRLPPGRPDAAGGRRRRSTDRTRPARSALLEALKAAGRPCRLVVAGSAAELGPVPEAALPVVETYPGQPVGPYGLSKWLASRLRACIAPGRSRRSSPGSSTRSARGCRPARRSAGSPRHSRAGARPAPLRVGDLDARRDFIDARDVAAALIALARGAAGPGLSRRHRRVAEHRRGARRVDPPQRPPGRGRGGRSAADRADGDSRADIGRIVGETGWSPRFAFEESLADLLAGAAGRRDSPGGCAC